MLIIDPKVLAVAIGAKCGGSAPSADDEGMNTVLNLILPRIEDAMNVASLVRGSFTDHFFMGAPTRNELISGRPAQLRLSNGLIDKTSLVVTDANNNVLTTDVVSLNDEYGIVEVAGWSRGHYAISYESGFEPEPVPDPVPEGYNPNFRILQDVPDWIQGIAVDLVVAWWRTQKLSPSVPKNVAYAALDGAIRRDVYVRVYGRYMRPRVGVTWSERLDRG